MARKEHHVVLNSGGGWDVKKGEGKKAINHFNKKEDGVGYGRKSNWKFLFVLLD